MNPSEKDLDRETLEFEPPETIEAERENLGEDFGKPPNGPDDGSRSEAVNIEFDEADALFGKRTGIKDSRGRY